MSNWFLDLFLRKPKDNTAADLTILLEAERNNTASLQASLIFCQTDRSKIFAAGQSAIREVSTQLKRVSELETQLEVYKDDIAKKSELLNNQSKDLKDLMNEKNQVLLDNLNLRKQLANRPVLSLPTLYDLPTYLKGLRGSKGFDDPELWWNIDKAVWGVFARWQITDWKDVSPKEFQDMVNAAYPNLNWTNIGNFDNVYRLADESQLEPIIKAFRDRSEFMANFRDCDKFAWEFVNYMNKFTLNSAKIILGYWGSEYHAREFVVGKNGGVFEHEGQNFLYGKVPPGVNDNFRGLTIPLW